MVQPLPLIDQIFGSYALIITQLIYFVITFLVVYFIGKYVFISLLNRVLNRYGIDEHVKSPIRKLSNIVVFFAAIGLAFGLAGFGNFLSSLTTIAAAATLAIGFALQDIIKNFVSGVFIYIEQPFKLGDWIEWNGSSGIVEDISLRVTRLRTFDNELITVPNFVLTNGVLKNPVAKDKLRLKFDFGISYEDDVMEATEIILEEASKNKDIMNDPEPVVRLDELGDSSVGLESKFWISNPSRSDCTRVKSEFVKAVKKRFDEAGIEFPFPQVGLSGKIDLKELS